MTTYTFEYRFLMKDGTIAPHRAPIVAKNYCQAKEKARNDAWVIAKSLGVVGDDYSMTLCDGVNIHLVHQYTA